MKHELIIKDLVSRGHKLNNWLKGALAASHRSAGVHMSESIIAQGYYNGMPFVKGKGISRVRDFESRKDLLNNICMAFSQDNVDVSGSGGDSLVCELRFEIEQQGDEKFVFSKLFDLMSELKMLSFSNKCAVAISLHMAQMGEEQMMIPHAHIAVSPSGAEQAKNLVSSILEDRLV